ncbi:FKBP-type peptidyl-prolyl cis-trans isomerase [Neolewinella lacunae]|uniref:Peptidyl-prolyl cis-trans isomerase n=1 Tax=Neolewinella lacunae TaxID=1517758 RepID=A0A923PJS2_9BACT|nr:FKBP-type peptidyl-prolyl cis-trans isomerase [Neolewinella lacunae]MBC6993966.1 FKBP-type peptidyl-prolyl cis-trans isomerase [Neolewinella lacunae]MDN3634953.1 FKBP-type peptidyl-prolyl cis-trans isomerase [Neolewinella lacunae]
MNYELKTSPITLLLCLFIACSGNPAPAAAPDAATQTAIEERLMAELAPSDDRAGRERNAIINRAIDQHYDVYAAPEGYFYEILQPGDYNLLLTGDLVQVHYRGSFLDGTVFQDSRQRGQPLEFAVGELIPAWNLGLLRARPGGAIRLLVPSHLAYGAAGLVTPRGDTLVPAHTPLEFLIEDIEILDPE